MTPKIDTQTVKGMTFYQAYGDGIVTIWFRSEELARADWAAKARKAEHAEVMKFLTGSN